MTFLHLKVALLFRFARWALEQYGNRVWKTAWGRVINTDFSVSGPIGKSGRRNSKTDIVWAKDVDSVRDLLDFPQEKYDENVMLWGGVSYKGLVPSGSPVFVDEMKVRTAL